MITVVRSAFLMVWICGLVLGEGAASAFNGSLDRGVFRCRAVVQGFHVRVQRVDVLVALPVAIVTVAFLWLVFVNMVGFQMVCFVKG
eukprot:CAMPEP_0172400102 /NCGR_PEP_ID=MMETSP1061-20121228/44210_1 /TAXON_ID=37318 /ORGANISM="Pseudo-nitzschia pungens, Strain cf. pungens" /LENGTH=86 /DNA_ID=CAMNT_0013133221 /DNA_START=161 /DNA_END=417 /DNA_ORIENTATION=+